MEKSIVISTDYINCIQICSHLKITSADNLNKINAIEWACKKSSIQPENVSVDYSKMDDHKQIIIKCEYEQDASIFRFILILIRSIKEACSIPKFGKYVNISLE